MIHSASVLNDSGTVLCRSVGRSRRKPRMGLYGLVAVALIAGSGAVVSGVQFRAAQESPSASADRLPPGPFAYFPR